MSDHGMINVLIVGESWISAATDYKGWDQFSSTTYESGVEPLRAALSAAGIGIVWMPSHEAARDFPDHADDLAQYDGIVLSDIGANTLPLHPDTWLRGQTRPNRLTVIRDWVSAGGDLAMAGGYLSFEGINASARYRGAPVEEVLPLRISPWDDRMEIPEGAFASVDRPDHPIVAGIDGPWPPLLGMNELDRCRSDRFLGRSAAARSAARRPGSNACLGSGHRAALVSGVIRSVAWVCQAVVAGHRMAVWSAVRWSTRSSSCGGSATPGRFRWD